MKVSALLCVVLAHPPNDGPEGIATEAGDRQFVEGVVRGEGRRAIVMQEIVRIAATLRCGDSLVRKK